MTIFSDKETLVLIEDKIAAATDLINEAQALARSIKVPFAVGIIREQRYDDEADEYVDVKVGEEYDYDRVHTGVVAGWAPSGLNC